jgi:hypothetical protein
MALTYQDPGCCCSGGACTCPTQICIEACGGTTPINGATITVATLAPQTTGVSGCDTFCLDPLGGAGSQQVTVSATGYYTYSNSVSLACNATETIKLLPITGNPSILFQINGCCALVLPGATVTIGGNNYTSDSAGQVKVGITDAGTYPWSVSKTRFVTQTGSVTIGACAAGGATVTVNMAPTTGYECGPGGSSGGTIPLSLADPVPTTLFLTDSVWGSATLTYSSITHNWSGSITITSPALCGCISQTGVVISYNLAQCQGGSYVTSCGSYGYNPLGLGAIPCPTNPGAATNTLGIPAIGGFTYTMNPTIPFDWQATYPAQACVPGLGASFPASLLYLYAAGATITVTE